MKAKKKIIRNSIKERLEKIDRSQGWLSRRTGIDRTHLGKIVNGTHNPGLLTAKKIADALTCLIDDLWHL